MVTTPFAVASRFIGVREVAGVSANPLVLAMLQLADPAVKDDAVPWCSAFVGFIAFVLGLPLSGSLTARSWLTVGEAVALADAQVGADVVVLQRGEGPQPGPDVIAAQGHVGFFAGRDSTHVDVLGGNQSDRVSIERFPLASVLGVRRLVR
jgi:uncharacterized protein (TIGR02594 family)